MRIRESLSFAPQPEVGGRSKIDDLTFSIPSRALHALHSHPERLHSSAYTRAITSGLARPGRWRLAPKIDVVQMHSSLTQLRAYRWTRQHSTLTPSLESTTGCVRSRSYGNFQAMRPRRTYLGCLESSMGLQKETAILLFHLFFILNSLSLDHRKFGTVWSPESTHLCLL